MPRWAILAAGTAVLALTLVSAGCGGSDGESSGNATAGSGDSAKTVTVKLDEQNGSGESGTATLTAEGSSTKVVLELENPASPDPQPAHIHTGNVRGARPDTCLSADERRGGEFRDDGERGPGRAEGWRLRYQRPQVGAGYQDLRLLRQHRQGRGLGRWLRGRLRLLEHGAQGGLGRPATAHPVNAAAGRRRGRAKEEPRYRGRVRDASCGRPEDQLREVLRTSVDVAAHEVPIRRSRSAGACARRATT